jgi:hypothetical protein
MIDSLKRPGNPAIVLVELWGFVNNYLCTLSQRPLSACMYSLSQAALTPGRETRAKVRREGRTLSKLPGPLSDDYADFSDGGGIGEAASRLGFSAILSRMFLKRFPGICFLVFC